MKRFVFRPVVLIFLAIGFVLSSAVQGLTGFSLFGKPRTEQLPSGEASNADLCALSYVVLETIKEGDYTALSKLAHPEYGIIFSPCATVDIYANRSFKSSEIAAFGTDKNDYIWGVSGSSGEPISMTPCAYFARYVYYKDYAAAPYIGINRIVRSGDALENIVDVFPGIRFIEFHMRSESLSSGDDVNWSALRLGFEVYNGSLWLAAIIHSEWS